MWPSLFSIGFVSDRAAIENDVENGNAVFVLQTNGLPIGEPIPIEIPQYAFHVDQEAGRRTPCIVIQAEAAGDQQIAGVRYLDGTFGAAFLWEFELLGDLPPEVAPYSR